jgi:hypothetical protein
MLRRFTRTLCALFLAAAGTVTLTGVAQADVIVGPGATGHVCTGYSYIQVNPTAVYWQTCAWADDDEVWFTVHFGNTGSSQYTIEHVFSDYYKSGSFHACQTAIAPNLVIPAHSVIGTSTSRCAQKRRTPAAWAATTRVLTGNYDVTLTTDTLQVQ